MFERLKRKWMSEDGRIVELPIEEIGPNPNQPRKYFDNRALLDLARSIEEYGVIQPVSVRIAENGYELISGERRVRAAEIAGLETVPAIVVDADTGQSAILSLLENLQREDLCFFEIAESYRNLVKKQGMSTEEVAYCVNESASSVVNRIRLLRLPQRVRKMIRNFRLSERQARAVMCLPTEEIQTEAVKIIHKEKLNAPQTEKLVDRLIHTHPGDLTEDADGGPHMARYTNALGRTVELMRQNGMRADLEVEQHDWGSRYIIEVKEKQM